MQTRVLVVGVVATCATLAMLAAQAPGKSLFKEDFEDGNRNGWYLTSGGSASLADDSPGIGSGNALFMTVSGGSTQRRLVANFNAVELLNVGDMISLRFDFRITGARDTNADGGFRFGLFDSRGTLQTSDTGNGASSGNASDDAGYFAMVSLGLRSRARLVEERGEDPHLLGGTDLKFHHTDDDFGGIDDALKHAAVFTIRRTGSNAIGLELMVDGKKTSSGEVSGDLRTRFDEIGFAGTNSSCNFVIDNIEVTSGVGGSTQRRR